MSSFAVPPQRIASVGEIALQTVNGRRCALLDGKLVDVVVAGPAEVATFTDLELSLYFGSRFFCKTSSALPQKRM